MATKKQHASSLWIHDDGRISCEEHTGGYFTSIIAKFPTLDEISTPLGTWERLSRADIAQMAEMIGRAPVCETCESIARNQEGK